MPQSHRKITVAGGPHTPYAWKFANAAARIAFTPTQGVPSILGNLTAEDLDREALQEDDGTLWRLTAATPTWQQVGGSSSSVSDALFRITDNGDPTKQIAFEASAISTGTTRTFSVPDASGAFGVVSTATPQPIGTAAPGSSAEVSKADHVHGHGVQAGGTLHANATTGAAGFMTAAQFDKVAMLFATEKALGNLGATPTINFGAATASLYAAGTLTANASVTLSNPPFPGHYQLRILTGTGSFTVTFATAVAWFGGVVYAATATASQEDVINLFWTGSAWRGQFSKTTI